MPDHFYVYPAYLGHGLSRSDGRRLPVADSVSDLTTDEILESARRLGFKAEVEAEKQYPRQFYTYAGRVKVTKRDGTTKSAFLRALAVDVRKHRPAGGKK
jgi:signal recognition particle subunit SRP19